MSRIKNKFVIEFPWLEGLLDEDALIKKFKNKNRPLEVHSDETAFETGNMKSLKMTDYGVDCIRIEEDDPIVTPLFKKLNYNAFRENPFGWFIHKYDTEMQTKVHTDKDRNGVLIYPMIPKSYTIVYVDPADRQTEIYRHTYRCPTMINASIPHYIEDSNLEKIHFQVSLFITDDKWYNVINDK